MLRRANAEQRVSSSGCTSYGAYTHDVCCVGADVCDVCWQAEQERERRRRAEEAAQTQRALEANEANIAMKRRQRLKEQEEDRRMAEEVRACVQLRLVVGC